jgi:hypothetical protein
MKMLFLCVLMTSILMAADGPPTPALLRIFNRR